VDVEALPTALPTAKAPGTPVRVFASFRGLVSDKQRFWKTDDELRLGYTSTA
jgi:hypothetical protein